MRVKVYRLALAIIFWLSLARVLVARLVPFFSPSTSLIINGIPVKTKLSAATLEVREDGIPSAGMFLNGQARQSALVTKQDTAPVPISWAAVAVRQHQRGTARTRATRIDSSKNRPFCVPIDCDSCGGGGSCDCSPLSCSGCDGGSACAGTGLLSNPYHGSGAPPTATCGSGTSGFYACS